LFARSSAVKGQPLVESAGEVRSPLAGQPARHEVELTLTAGMNAHTIKSTEGFKVQGDTLALGDFKDLYELSCLNGWTMGNIATSPSELMLFYHELMNGHIVSPASLSRMMSFQSLTTGFATGTPYGFGLMVNEIRLPLENVRACNGLPGCKCSFFRCELQDVLIGHAGLDYGSGVPSIGYMPSLNLSFAIAINVGEVPIGMNSTLSTMTNYRGVLSFQCALLDAVIHEQLPRYPKFQC